MVEKPKTAASPAIAALSRAKKKPSEEAVSTEGELILSQLIDIAEAERLNRRRPATSRLAHIIPYFGRACQEGKKGRGKSAAVIKYDLQN